MGSGFSAKKASDRPPGRDMVLWWTPRWAYGLSIATAIVVFSADVVLPRGATAAIGYCLVPAIAAATRRRGFLFTIAVVCTVLTWFAIFVEPAGDTQWRSLFDRVMVTGVIWLALLLVLRRAMIVRELTFQRQALRDATLELERSNGELSNFASVVAHDLRGPLNTVGLLSQLLSSSSLIKADAECGSYLSSIQAELSRMSGFIQSLLTYGRVGSGDLRLQACDCASVLRDVRQDLKADLERKCVEISNDPLPMIRADPVLIAHLFQNLIENSIKYRSGAPPRIHVSAAWRSGSWLFSVQDNGIGIRSEDSELIFKPFHQTGEGKSPDNGVGLGLATCKRIVERHAGRMYVQSKPGEGTTFFFTMPQDAVMTKPTALSAMAEPAGDDMNLSPHPC